MLQNSAPTAVASSIEGQKQHRCQSIAPQSSCCNVSCLHWMRYDSAVSFLNINLELLQLLNDPIDNRKIVQRGISWNVSDYCLDFRLSNACSCIDHLFVKQCLELLIVGIRCPERCHMYSYWRVFVDCRKIDRVGLFSSPSLGILNWKFLKLVKMQSISLTFRAWFLSKLEGIPAIVTKGGDVVSFSFLIVHIVSTVYAVFIGLSWREGFASSPGRCWCFSNSRNKSLFVHLFIISPLVKRLEAQSWHHILEYPPLKFLSTRQYWWYVAVGQTLAFSLQSRRFLLVVSWTSYVNEWLWICSVDCIVEARCVLYQTNLVKLVVFLGSYLLYFE